MAKDGTTIHASAVLVGTHAVLIRGPAGAGKSRLALALIQAAQSGIVSFARLVGDDRVHLAAAHGRLLVRPAEALAGLIEVRGLGIRRLDHEGVAVVGLVVDLGSPAAERLPGPAGQEVSLEGVLIPLLSLPESCDAMPAVLGSLLTRAAEV
jgi:HPr kinase/phosphorylase